MTSHWLKDCGSRFDALKGQPLPEEVVDVVIIGAGMSGASTAYQLAQHGLTESVVLLEKNGISSGATGNNGGFICPGLSEPYSDAVEKFGEDSTKAMFEFSAHCTWYVMEFANKRKAECELRMEGSVELASTEEELIQMEERFAKVSGLPYGGTVQWWDAAQCQTHTGSRKYLGGMFRRTAGLLWAAKVVYGLVEEAVKLGVKVHTYTPVQSVYRGNQDGTISVLTDRGVIRTRKVVYCMNAWSRDLLPQLQDIIVPVRNQLIMTPPLPKLWKFGLSANSGYVYFMQRPDGRILVGGMRDKTPTMEVNNADTVTLDKKMGRALREYLPVHFPQLIKYFTGQCNKEEDEDKETDEKDAECEENGNEDGEGEEALSDAFSSSHSVDSADAREYVVPSTSTAAAGTAGTAVPSSTTATATHTGSASNNTKPKSKPTKPPRIPLTPVESEWIGIMGFTPDRNPLVGPLDSSKFTTGSAVAADTGAGAGAAMASVPTGATRTTTDPSATTAPVAPPVGPPAAAPVAASGAALSDTPLLNIDSVAGYLAYAINTSVVHSLVGMRLNNTHSEYIAAGYTGHGMPVAFLAGKNIADLICGVASDPPIPAAYSPSRYNL